LNNNRGGAKKERNNLTCRDKRDGAGGELRKGDRKMEKEMDVVFRVMSEAWGKLDKNDRIRFEKELFRSWRFGKAAVREVLCDIISHAGNNSTLKGNCVEFINCFDKDWVHEYCSALMGIIAATTNRRGLSPYSRGHGVCNATREFR
jgi:hypothetical protein